MEPTTQSFIPKKPMEGAGYKVHHGNPLLAVAILVLIGAVAASGAVYAYNLLLNREISSLESKLQAEQKKFSAADIEELARTNERIESAKKILEGHLAVSSFFALLESLTVRSVQFTELQFGDTKSATRGITLKGMGKTFNSVALQSDILSKQKDFKNTIFSGLALDEFGNVSFAVRTEVDPSSILYRNTVSGALVETPTPTPSPSPGASASPSPSGSPKGSPTATPKQSP